MRRVRDLFVVLAAISWMVGRATNSTGKAAIVPITKLIRGLPIALEDFYNGDTPAETRRDGRDPCHGDDRYHDGHEERPRRGEDDRAALVRLGEHP